MSRDAKPELPDQFFDRQDESGDEQFYSEPRFVTHIDDATINNLTSFYAETFTADDRLLDLMSSWVSHLPAGQRYRKVVGLGMNEAELARNPQLDVYQVQNLNTNPFLAFPEESFEAVTIAVSIQYLVKPFEVFREIARVLSPGGKCIVAMSHRLFPTKAIKAFHVMSREDRVRLVSVYMSQTDAFDQIEFVDRSPANADPLWLVVGTKES